MPLNTPVRRIAERILILTEALRDSAKNEKYDELNGLFQSRQEAIDQIATMEIDSGARALLDRVSEAESGLMSQLQRTQAGATRELIHMFAGTRNVQVYKSNSEKSAFQRTG